MRTLLWGACVLLIACAPRLARREATPPLCPPSVILHLEDVQRGLAYLPPNGTPCRWMAALVRWCSDGEIRSPDDECLRQ